MGVNLCLLEDAAVLGDCNVIQENINELSEVYFAHILGHMCRFGRAECVKKLLVSVTSLSRTSPECYKSDGFHRVTSYSCMLLDYCPWGEYCLPVRAYGWYRCSILSKEVKRTIPKAERLKILDLLLEYRDLINFDPGVLLFYALLCEDYDIVSALYANDIRLSHVVCRDIFSRRPGMFWYALIRSLNCSEMYFERFLDIAKSLCQASEGGTLHCTMKLLEQNSIVFDNVEVMRQALQCFNHSDLNKLHLMRRCVYDHAVEYLALFEEIGWLKRSLSCDALLDYVTKLEKTELIAWLLDYKNRTRDLAAEQKKIEKQAERELTASPDSVYMMKKLWGFKKLDDDTLQIISYKGNSTEIVVPDKIGKRKVTSIGTNAFTRYNKKVNARSITSIVLPEGIIRLQDRAFYGLESIQSILLPESVRYIGEGCFCLCGNLQAITIPMGVRVIKGDTFYNCSHLESVVLLEGIEVIHPFAFHLCANLSRLYIPASVKEIGIQITGKNTLLAVHEGSVAHKYCLDHNISFEIIK